ncbi:Nitroreductase domain-containing protein, partial [Dysosmobacter welbionis]
AVIFPARRINSISWGDLSVIIRSSPQCVEDGPGGLFHRGLILHRLQESPLGIEVLQRLGLLMIDLEPRLDGLGGIIFPLDQ